MRYRDRLGRSDLAMLYNVSAEFAHSLDTRPVSERARSAVFSSIPDAVLVSGAITGEAARMEDLEAVKRVLPETYVMANTGVKHATVKDVLAIADGCIVGSSLKVDGHNLECRGSGSGEGLHGSGARDEGLTDGHADPPLAHRAHADPGLSGHEGRVRRYLRRELDALGLSSRTDRLGNLIATIAGDPDAPSVMLFTHMDQLGLVVRRIEANGMVRVERLGGVPDRALPAQAVIFSIGEGRDVPGVIANKSHHATTPEEKFKWCRMAISTSMPAFPPPPRCGPPASTSARRSSTARR